MILTSTKIPLKLDASDTEPILIIKSHNSYLCPQVYYKLYLVVAAILNIWIISCRRKCFDLIIILAVHVFIVISVTQRLIHIIHNSEHPASCFASLDTGTILVSDFHNYCWADDQI
jgi:hypothetical protein